ncbi:beta-glucan synthesis-associated protein KRE6 [Gymnopilus junonius]|uniref:Beta-glucan synthesis-associated protein KRE6 n=1 Tax=Gymnopilus junonius TaxID=109634 RepID=A0A9P5TKF8_GYMJU|nr:beta-glucan synthesis-associated protein KRE6 [Gymnopilus junonius]
MSGGYQHSQASASATSLLLSDQRSTTHSVAEKYSLPPSPMSWGMPIDPSAREPDDYLHNPDPLRDRRVDKGGNIFTSRGVANLGCLFIIAAGCLMLFAGYPILSHFMKHNQSTQGGFNLGGINATGQVPKFPTNFAVVDPDTPSDALSRPSFMTGDEWQLVFSDEFNVDGRTFYPGDDPFWEAVDLHYWGTNDLEWYDPSQITTKNGSLQFRIDKVDNPADNHNMTYKSGMVRNKFCFTGGLIEAAVTLPGSNSVSGLWPAVWTMGNLGRAGFGATLDGMWPYTYDACDVGTLPNQTYPGTNTPAAAFENGDPSWNNVLSFLPGQRLSACTCSGESHPGPMRSDGSYVGRSAPEIDIFEALIGPNGGQVSLSAQWAPYNAGYNWQNTSANLIIYNQTTGLNGYKGGVYQQTTSGLGPSNPNCYEQSSGGFATYAFEYQPGFDNAYITWVNDGQKAWTLNVAGMGADRATEISARPVPQEPMYIIANLGFSKNFAEIEFDKLTFPSIMSIDYIRVYQPKSALNIGCDPTDFPTAAYIETYIEAYTNFNVTTWADAGQPWPKNRLANSGQC